MTASHDAALHGLHMVGPKWTSDNRPRCCSRSLHCRHSPHQSNRELSRSFLVPVLGIRVFVSQ